MAWNIHKWSLQREGVRLQVPLFSSRCAFYFPKYPFIFQYCPFIFQKCPFVFQKCLFISQSCPLVWSAVFLFTVPVFFKNAFFQLIILFQLIVLFLLRADPCSCFFHSWNYLLTNLCLASYLCSHSSNNFEGFFCWYLIEYLKILKCKNNFCFKTLVPGSNQKVTPT